MEALTPNIALQLTSGVLVVARLRATPLSSAARS
jgi:hypothetical protein